METLNNNPTPIQQSPVPAIEQKAPSEGWLSWASSHMGWLAVTGGVAAGIVSRAVYHYRASQGDDGQVLPDDPTHAAIYQLAWNITYYVVDHLPVVDFDDLVIFGPIAWAVYKTASRAIYEEPAERGANSLSTAQRVTLCMQRMEALLPAREMTELLASGVILAALNSSYVESDPSFFNTPSYNILHDATVAFGLGAGARVFQKCGNSTIGSLLKIASFVQGVCSGILAQHWVLHRQNIFTTYTTLKHVGSVCIGGAIAGKIAQFFFGATDTDVNDIEKNVATSIRKK